MTEVRSKYHISLNNIGFNLRGAPSRPQYIKERAPSLVNQLGLGDLNYNSLNGSGWSFWTQTDWSGGFQKIKFKDDASFKDGQAIDPLKKYGEVTLQKGWTSGVKITGGHSFGSKAVHNLDLILGTVKSGGAKIFKYTSANAISTLSAMVGISAVNSMSRFKNDTLIGLTRTSGSLKTLVRYNGTAISGFRSANPIVRAVKGIGIRAYISEYVAALSGDTLSYATNLSGFISGYQAGKGRKIKIIEDLQGVPFFFVVDGYRVEFFQFDETTGVAIPIYVWENLTNFGVKKYLSDLIITGTSNGKSIAYSFDGNKLDQIFDDQIQDTSYDFSKPFEFAGNLHVKGASYDGDFWSPGIYGKFNDVYNYTPFENFSNKVYGYFTSGTHMRIGYQDNTKYAISGHIISSEFGSNVGAVDKLVNAVDINTSLLSVGESVELFKSIDGGASFTSIGKSSFAQDGSINKKTLYFPSGFVTKLWNYKVQLVGNGTTTPSISDVTFQYRVIPDLRRRWSLSVDAGDKVILLNKQEEDRDGKALVQDLWREMEAKKIVPYEDVDAFEVTLTRNMAATATSATVSDTRLMPPRGRMRIKLSGTVEEMEYTSADGGRIRGITRSKKNTLARNYLSGTKVDNFYNAIITDIKEQINNTDQMKTESIAQITILEV